MDIPSRPIPVCATPSYISVGNMLSKESSPWSWCHTRIFNSDVCHHRLYCSRSDVPDLGLVNYRDLYARPRASSGELV